MQLIIAAVGHKMPAWIESGFGEYTKRMPPELRIVLKEIKPVERSGSKTAATAMALERERIEAVLPKGVRIIALDERGNLAAATSTGGLTGKRWGRVGDSPIIGAGTYAANDACAVSATGHGEYFIRLAAAHEIAALMRHRGLAVAEAATTVVRRVGELGGYGGVIAIARDGTLAMPFNSDGMLRGAMDSSGRLEVGILKDDLKDDA